MKMLSLLCFDRSGGLGRAPLLPRSSPRRNRPSLLARPQATSRQKGFTLVEMLVVIAIIAMLVGLVTVAAFAARRRVIVGTIGMELNQLQVACEHYKEKFGEYPPDGTGLDGALGAPAQTVVQDAMLRHLAKAFPRYQPGISTRDPSTGVFALTGWDGFRADVLGIPPQCVPGYVGWNIDVAAISPASALTFWLAGKPIWRLRTNADSDGPAGSVILPGHAAFDVTLPVAGFNGFSANVQNPFDNSPSRINPFFDFSPTQVQWFLIRLMCYPRAVAGGTAANSYIYFRAENGQYTLNGAAMGSGGIMKSYPTPANVALVVPAADWRLMQVAPFTWTNAQSFQIFCAGLDATYTAPTNAGAGPLQFPNGTNYGASTWDDITNFSEGTLEDSRR